MPGEAGARGVSGGGGASGRGGGEPESEGLVATERHGGNNWTVHIVKDDSQGFPVAVEGHDVLGEIQHDSHSISLPEQVVFATEGVEEGASYREQVSLPSRRRGPTNGSQWDTSLSL